MNYAGLQRTSIRLHTQHGAAATLHKRTSVSTNPTTLKRTPTFADRPVHAVETRRIFQVLDAASKLAAVEFALSVSPELPAGEHVAVGDEITFGGTRSAIRDVRRTMPDGATPLAYLVALQ